MAIPDDAPVPPETELYRRVRPSAGRYHLVPDENKDCIRLSSAFFGELESSVVLEDRLRETGRAPLDVLAPYPEDFLVATTAAVAFDHDLEVKRQSTDEEPAHGAIVGKKKKRAKLALIRNVRWIKAPDDLCPDESGTGST